MIHNSIQPHPIKCPNIYITDFSSNQGWIEGALETSDKVLYAILNNIKPLKLGKKILILNMSFTILELSK